MTLNRRQFLGGALALACCPVERVFAEAPEATATESWLARWLTAFNSSRAATYPAFVRAHAPTLVPYLDDDLGVREASGGFRLLRSEMTGTREITAWVRDRNWDRFSKVALTMGNDGIDDLSFSPAPPPPAFAIHRSNERNALARLRKKLDREAAAGRFSGTVLVARHGTVLLQVAHGAQSTTPDASVTARTRFCIGSMGKMFTAVAVLRLVQDGRLRLTDTIASLLPDYPPTPLARQVTIEHLLMHTGGTGDFFGAEYEAHQAELRTPSDFVRRFGARALAFAPGARWGYSNFGFILLGAVIERITNTPWDAHIDATVFQAAGMTSTSPQATADDTAKPCTGATYTGLRALPYYVGLPAGGGYSTVSDLHRFAEALRNGRLLDDTHVTMLTRARVAAGTAQWSLGLRVASRNGAAYYGHGGSAPGVNADFAVYPASGYQTVVLSNRGHPHAANVADFIGSRLPLAAS